MEKLLLRFADELTKHWTGPAAAGTILAVWLIIRLDPLIFPEENRSRRRIKEEVLKDMGISENEYQQALSTASEALKGQSDLLRKYEVLANEIRLLCDYLGVTYEEVKETIYHEQAS